MLIGILLLCLLLGGILLQSLTFTMVQEYNEREEGLEGVTFGMIWNHLWRNIKRVMKSTLACSGAIIAMLALSLLNPLALILFIPAMIVLIVPMLMFPCIYTFENISMKDAVSKAIRLGFGTWVGLFVINMVFSFIMNIISQAVSIPWAICAVMAMIFGEDANAGRIYCAVGYSDADFDISKVDIDMASKGGSIALGRQGCVTEFDEEVAKQVLAEDEIQIIVSLGEGSGTAVCWGCDLTYDYVKINGDYRS